MKNQPILPVNKVYKYVFVISEFKFGRWPVLSEKTGSKPWWEQIVEGKKTHFLTSWSVPVFFFFQMSSFISSI